MALSPVRASVLASFVDAATGLYPAVVLSIRAGSPAVRLCERHGFTVERRIVNRVGGESLAMRRRLR